MLEDFLPLVTKPARYINSEINAVHKDLTRVKTKVCLFFPDTYEVGMSHIGLRILYHILNSRPDTACERVFSPWTDYEDRLRASGRPLTSLESNLPLADFDLIGVTLQYELSYSNILTGLELARIPLHAKDRTESHPVIIAGGPCAVNPEPLSDFIDVFFIGEAEEAMHEIVELKQATPGRAAFLEALSTREGFYVPALGKRTVRKRFIKDLDSAPFPDKPILPLMKPIHDRVTVEIARGCIRGCRFCQAGIIYRPYRERSAANIKNILAESLRCTGYDELSLASLSSGDHSDIEPLMKELVDTYRKDRISISLPSLRIGTLTPGMIRSVAGVRKSGFTLAPEAGTERLRKVINKPVSDQDLMNAAETIFKNGWNVLKLYFMIGLPTETNEDLDGIIKLAHDTLAVGRRLSRRPVQINITVSTFVPKPHTPFQWFGQTTREEIKAKQAYLDKGLRRKGISLKPHGSDTSLLEGAFARGDRAIGRVIEQAVKLGCRFDGWSECFDFNKWSEAFRMCGLDPAEYACRTFGTEDALPWDHIRSGVTKEFLKREYQQAQAAEITENCRVACEHCGIGCKDGGTDALGKPGLSDRPSERALHQDQVLSAPSSQKDLSAVPNAGMRIRMKFTKTGRLCFLSHLDLMTLFQRAAARAGIPIAFSQGFNPHPKIAFGPALSVGIESVSEYLDMETSASVDLLAATKAMNSMLPSGMRVLESRRVPPHAPSLSGSIGRYQYEVNVPASYVGSLEEQVRNFLLRSEVVVEKDGKKKDLRPCIESIAAKNVQNAALLDMILVDSFVDQNQVKPRAQDVVAQLFAINAEKMHAFGITRIHLYCKEGNQWKSPMED